MAGGRQASHVKIIHAQGPSTGSEVETHFFLTTMNHLQRGMGKGEFLGGIRRLDTLELFPTIHSNLHGCLCECDSFIEFLSFYGMALQYFIQENKPQSCLSNKLS